MRIVRVRNTQIVMLILSVMVGIAGCEKVQNKPMPTQEKGAYTQQSADATGEAKTYRLASEEAVAQVTTVKNHSTPVTGVFRAPAGLLQLQKDVLSGFVGVSTAQYDTGLSARDANIQEVFFQNAVSMAAAKASIQVEGWRVPALAWSESVAVEIPVRVDMFGASAAVTMPAHIQVHEDGIHLAVHDFAISFDALQLRSRLILLMERCNHQAVSEDFAIDFSGYFKRSVSPSVPAPE